MSKMVPNPFLLVLTSFCVYLCPVWTGLALVPWRMAELMVCDLNDVVLLLFLNQSFGRTQLPWQKDTQAALWRSLQGEEWMLSTNIWHQFATPEGEFPLKWILQSQASLQMTAAWLTTIISWETLGQNSLASDPHNCDVLHVLNC